MPAKDPHRWNTLALGTKVNMLTVVGPVVQHQGKKARVLCQCECGVEREFDAAPIKHKRTISCGCMRPVTYLSRSHGCSREGQRTPEYRVWATMLQRCRNPNNSKFYMYGERGISVCKRWDQFKDFISDMGNRPTSRHSIDRIDVNGNYEPSNCRWATAQEQALNTRKSIAKRLRNVPI